MTKKWPSTVFKHFRNRIVLLNGKHDQLLFVFSAYGLPLAIGFFSLLAYIAWQPQFSFSSPSPLDFQAISTVDVPLEPQQAVEQLATTRAVTFFDTKLSETPFWISIKLPEEVGQKSLMIEFPSRHTVSIACWDAHSLKSLGTGSKAASTGSISPIKAGFAVEIHPESKVNQILCNTSAVGPARISALAWPPDMLVMSEHEFHRKSGLLDGGIIVLTLFVLITALINRRILYVLFAAWLLVNLRMAALSAGWDSQWIGNAVPLDWLSRSRSVTLALYYLLTAALFYGLFEDDLKKVGSLLLLRLAQWSCLPLLGAAVILDYKSFLPVVWIASGLGIGVLVYYLIRVLLKTRSRVAMWYSASITITLAASFYEVIAAALGVKGLIGSVNSVTAALSSSLLAALAIAEQMRQEHEQRLDLQAELTHTYEAMPIGLFTLDLRGRFISANPAMLDMLSPNLLEPGGNAWQQYFSDGAWTALHQMVLSQNEDEMEIKGRPILGFAGRRRFLVKATLARDKIEGSLQDVTEKSRATEDLYFLANHDSLTKVLNRRGIEKALSSSIADFTEGRALALAYLDLDRFKLINDLFGHAAGDDVLQQVCCRVSALLSPVHKFGRVGGDEFVIVFPDTGIALATLMCRGIVDAIDDQPYRVGDQAFHVRGSIGLIEISTGMQFNDAMSAADRACRQAKAGNCDGLVVYEKHALAFQQHEDELRLTALLATSSATDGLYLEMQPIMSLTAPHDSLNFEVLLRMRGPDGKLVPTDRLIAAGERSGRMSMIDRWVLTTTLEWLDTHYMQMTQTRFICMNLSGASLNDEKFLHDVYLLLEKNIHLVGHICLEITESVALHDIDNTRKFVNKVRGYGAKVALDDFGAGYTSFSYLKEFTADLLKIDGSFIVNMNQHPANIAIVEAIVNLARNLGMKVIAEWAEDNATVQTLTEIGVDYVQGFAVARSQAPEKMISAKSSASFIQDEELMQFVDLIGAAEPPSPQVELFTGAKIINIH